MWTEPLGYMKYYIGQTGLVDDPNCNSMLLDPKFVGNLDLRTYADLMFQGQFSESIFEQIKSEWMNFAVSFPDVNAPYWKERQILSRTPEIRVPTYHVGGIGGIGGLHGDCCSGDSLNNFLMASTGKYWKRHHLMLGNWDHGDSTPYDDGSNLHPLTTYQHGFNAIMSHYLKRTLLPFPDDRVVIQSNFGDPVAANGEEIVVPRVITAEQYPPPGLKKDVLYFHQNGSTLSLSESKATAPSESEESTYVDDPTKLNLFPVAPDPSQNLIFNFKPSQEMPFMGNMSLDLFVRVDTPQADIIAVPLQTVPATGGMPAQMNILTMCKLVGRAGGDHVVHLKTGSCPMMADLKPGDTLSVLITSNLYPTYARNTNNAPGDGYYDLPPKKATISLLHSEKYPSRIDFTLEPRGLAEEVLPKAKP